MSRYLKKKRRITNFSIRAHKQNKAQDRQARNGRAYNHGAVGTVLSREVLHRLFGGAPKTRESHDLDSLKKS